MRVTVFAALFGVVMLWAGIANAGMVETTLYLCDPPCCEFTCFTVDVECCGWCDETDPLSFEFLGKDGEVLGTAMIDEQWCGGCLDVHYAQLDNMIKMWDVSAIRVTAAMDECCFIEWMAIKALCEEPCCKSKWRTVWKGDVWRWEPVE